MASTSINQWKYDIFLSFRGVDVRKNFLSHLHAALRRKGVYAFKDDKELERGKPTSDDLLQAIKDSRFCIIIFSKRYADSTWCLDELVTIYECVQQEKVTAIPVFYGVKTCDVQELEGDYGEAFKKHKKDYDIQKVHKWELAITKLGLHSGHTLQNRDEEEFINDIVGDIVEQLRKLREKLPRLVEKGLVGMDKHLQQLDSYLSKKPNDVCIIGICGMGGIGKTTVARTFFDEKSSQFEGSSFLANVRNVEEKHGLCRLQKQLLSEILLERNLRIWEPGRGVEEIQNRLWHKNVLIVLDDIDKLEQLESLAAKSNWFGPGSRIIITTRDEKLLTFYDECLIYRVPTLDDDDAHQLFYYKAFRNGCLGTDFEDLSSKFVEYCNGLPLAINVLGSLLRGIDSINEWKSLLLRLKEIPDAKIIDKLKISFDKLQETEQKIFLDIACFFKGYKQDRVKRILESCGFYPDYSIGVLINKSLITIRGNEVRMHDLLQEMGREIVRRQSCNELGKRNRLWLYKDVHHVLLNNTGTEEVEGIMIEDSHKQEVEWLNAEALSIEAFSKMKRLRLLRLQYLQINHGFEFLPNSLKYLDWYQFPLKSLPNQFQPNELVELHLCHSSIKLLWMGIKSLRMLKFINLSYSEKLEKTPNFTKVLELEELILKGCTRLFEVHRSIGVLKKLISLDLEDCENLTTLPNSIGNAKSLKVLNLKGCSRLIKLPESLGQLISLERLNLARRGNEERLAKPWNSLLPWKRTTNRMSLTLPSSLSNLHSLVELNLSYCHIKGGLPNDFGCFPLLEKLNLTGNDFVSLPSSISRLSSLWNLNLDNCRKLKIVPKLPSNVWLLNMNGCVSVETFPTPSKDFNTYGLTIRGANCFKLGKNQDNTNIIFEWLANYLKCLTEKYNGQRLCWDHFKFSVFISGDVIPGWFNFRGFDAPMIVPLPPNWYNDQLVGFAFCIITVCRDPECRSTPFFDLLIPVGGHYYDYSITFSFEEAQGDQLCLGFRPINVNEYCEECKDLPNKVGHIEIHNIGYGFKIKSWGVRMVYKQDVEELLQNCSHFGNQKFLTIREE